MGPAQSVNQGGGTAFGHASNGELLVATEKTDMNAPVQPGDTRVSFTQFTSSGLFHHVDNSYRTEGELADTDPAEYARLMEKKQLRREEGLQIYSTVDEFANTE
ncbi:hypothetical protein B0H14DRAFT_2584082 [Mycena olivaceomarginata]|nr:hypothetical protein B0H14DRAFT_2584082 [Mycena olivaceomarginata]